MTTVVIYNNQMLKKHLIDPSPVALKSCGLHSTWHIVTVKLQEEVEVTENQLIAQLHLINQLPCPLTRTPASYRSVLTLSYDYLLEPVCAHPFSRQATSFEGVAMPPLVCNNLHWPRPPLNPDTSGVGWGAPHLRKWPGSKGGRTVNVIGELEHTPKLCCSARFICHIRKHPSSFLCIPTFCCHLFWSEYRSPEQSIGCYSVIWAGPITWVSNSD